MSKVAAESAEQAAAAKFTLPKPKKEKQEFEQNVSLYLNWRLFSIFKSTFFGYFFSLYLYLCVLSAEREGTMGYLMH